MPGSAFDTNVVAGGPSASLRDLSFNLCLLTLPTMNVVPAIPVPSPRCSSTSPGPFPSCGPLSPPIPLSPRYCVNRFSRWARGTCLRCHPRPQQARQPHPDREGSGLRRPRPCPRPQPPTTASRRTQRCPQGRCRRRTRRPQCWEPHRRCLRRRCTRRRHQRRADRFQGVLQRHRPLRPQHRLPVLRRRVPSPAPGLTRG